jgi:aminotransferase
MNSFPAFKLKGGIRIEEHVVERLLKMPSWPFQRLADEIATVKTKPLDLGQGEPDFDTPKHIKEALIKAVEQGYTHYTYNPGQPELREAIAEKLRKDNGVEVDPKGGVLVTFGGSEAILLCAMGLLDPGDEVIIPDPGYVAFAPVIGVVGGRVVRVPLVEETNYQLDTEALDEKITSRTKFVLINSPNNPTGTVLTRDNLEAIAEIVKRRKILVVVDEVYEKMVYDGARHISMASLPGMAERTITINGFSKAYAMTGLRIGYMAGPKSIITNFAKIHAYGAICVTSAVQRAALAAYQGSQDCVRDMVAEYAARRKLIIGRVSKMPGMRVQNPQGAFYIFPNISEHKTPSWDFSINIIKKAGVITTPGQPFGELGENHIRISYATSREKITEAMDRIEALLTKRL